MNDLHLHIASLIKANDWFAEGEQIVVAVSGGVDSMVLLAALAELAPRHAWQLTVAHFNHKLRGRASDQDQRFVQQYALKLGLPYHTESGAVRELAKREKLSLEMAARQARHVFLARTARQCGARKVALAHHADDQRELFFLRLLRGAGVQGLGGMAARVPSPADPKVHLIRPLLAIPRCSIEAYAKQQRIPFREDATNAKLEPLRNRVRHQLLPLLMRWQPGLTQTVPRLMQILRDEADYLNAETHQWLRRKNRPFEKLAVALQRRVLVEQLLALGQAPEFDWIEHLRRHPNVPITLAPRRIVVRKADGTLRLVERLHDPTFAVQSLPVSLKAKQGEVKFAGHAFTWQKIKCIPANRRLKSHAGIEHFDAAAIGARITLRHWQAGDRFWPIGAPGEVKLQDFFTNQKVPRAERHRRVVAAAGDGRIFWVEGLRIAEPFKLTERTRNVLEWRWGTNPPAE